MGTELGSVVFNLVEEIADLSILFSEYKVLCESGEERVQLLNRAAPNFFHRIQILMERELILGIGRITDKEMSLGTIPNLTVRKLEKLVEAKLPGKGASVKTVSDSALAAASFVTDWRNRWLAHRDLELSVNPATARPLDRATLGKIDDALKALCSVMNSVFSTFGFTGKGLGDFPAPFGGASSLVKVIDKGMRVPDPQS